MKILILLCFLFAFGRVVALPAIWELTDGQWLGLGATFNSKTQETGSSILKFSYQDESVIVNGVQYSIPDQCFGRELDRAINDTQIYITKNYKEYFESYVETTEISASLVIYGVPVSGGFERTQQQINYYLANNQNYISTNSLTWTGFVLQLYPSFHLSDLDSQFVADVESLPKEYDPYIYRKFIESYGTHVLTKVTYGCEWNVTLVYSSALLTTRKEAWVKQQVEAAIGSEAVSFGITDNSFNNDTQVDKYFLANSFSIQQVAGGNEEALNFKDWYSSCQFLRTIIWPNTRATPIAEFIINPTIKANVIEALKIYAAEA